MDNKSREEKDKDRYFKNYKEIKVLGRGAFGCAYLVKNLINNRNLVAKKMILDGLSQKDSKSAWKQIDILKQLSDLQNPFIVQYYQTFFFDNILIIIIEYCEEGDLAIFLKQWKSRGTHIDERVIANWFIQLMFGIKSLHSKSILHRDIKAANIFLTKNKTVKIGDSEFQKFQTVRVQILSQELPYICPPKCAKTNHTVFRQIYGPWAAQYTNYALSKYKQITQYPFKANNLCGLVIKIISDEVQPIPSCYSRQLNDLLMKLFIKDHNKRITIDQMFKSPYILGRIQNFQEEWKSLQTIISETSAIKFIPNSIQNEGDSNQDTMKTINSVIQNSHGSLQYSQTLEESDIKPYDDPKLTHAQRLKRKKIYESDLRAQQLKQAVQKNDKLKDFAKQKRQQTLGQSGVNFSSTIKKLQKDNYDYNKALSEAKKTQKYMKMQRIDMTQLQQTINKVMTIREKNTIHQDIAIPNDSDFLMHEQKIIQVTKQPVFEEQVIEQDLQQYFDQQFEQVPEDMANSMLNHQMEDVRAFYDNQIGIGSVSPSKNQKVANAFKKTQIQVLPYSQKVKNKQKACIEKIGQKKYEQLYSYLQTYLKQGKNIPPLQIKSKFNRRQQQVMPQIEEIIFLKNDY